MRGRLKVSSTRALAGYFRDVTDALLAYPGFHGGGDEADFRGELRVSKFADDYLKE